MRSGVRPKMYENGQVKAPITGASPEITFLCEHRLRGAILNGKISTQLLVWIYEISLCENSIQFKSLQFYTCFAPSMRWLRVLYAFERCCPCFLFLALCTPFRFFLDFNHFSFFRRPSVAVLFFFRQKIFFRYYYYYYYFLNLFPYLADHEPD